MVQIKQWLRFQIIADQPYCIQLTNDCLARDELRVSENLLCCRQRIGHMALVRKCYLSLLFNSQTVAWFAIHRETLRI
jgi:hypothetical protein